MNKGAEDPAPDWKIANPLRLAWLEADMYEFDQCAVFANDPEGGVAGAGGLASKIDRPPKECGEVGLGSDNGGPVHESHELVRRDALHVSTYRGLDSRGLW